MKKIILITLILFVVSVGSVRAQPVPPIVDYGPQVNPYRSILVAHVAFGGMGKGSMSRIAHIRFNPPSDGLSCRRAVFMMPESAYTRALMEVMAVGEVASITQYHGNTQVIVNDEGYLIGFKNEAEQIAELKLLRDRIINREDLENLVLPTQNVLEFPSGVDDLCKGRISYIWVDFRFEKLESDRK